MSKDTDKPASNVQPFSDFGQFLATHRCGQAIKQAVKEQGFAQPKEMEPVEPLAAPARKPSGP